MTNRNEDRADWLIKGAIEIIKDLVNSKPVYWLIAVWMCLGFLHKAIETNQLPEATVAVGALGIGAIASEIGRKFLPGKTARQPENSPVEP